jgi:hypothetical protein
MSGVNFDSGWALFQVGGCSDWTGYPGRKRRRLGTKEGAYLGSS